MPIDEKDKEIVFLRDRIYQLETKITIFQKQTHSSSSKLRYSLKERLFILWHMEYFKIPKRHVTKTFGIARSTMYRWLRPIDDEPISTQRPWNKTPESLAALVWRISKDNINWGRVRISNQLKLLNVFLSASTVRNILQRPKPKIPTPILGSKKCEPRNENGCRIPAWYPNHLWSIDLTEVYYWGLWKIYILIAIDHFSRKVVAATPLEGPSTGFVINALEAAFESSGKPKHIITDHGSVFTSAAFREFLDSNKVKLRYGAIGEHGSIAVTERVIETLKYEWLKKVAIIRGYRHLVKLCSEFTEWYNNWRPHEFLGSATPAIAFRGKAVPLSCPISTVFSSFSIPKRPKFCCRSSNRQRNFLTQKKQILIITPKTRSIPFSTSNSASLSPTFIDTSICCSLTGLHLLIQNSGSLK